MIRFLLRSKLGLGILLLLGIAFSVGATTRHVPVNYPTIQAALDSLSEGDSVLVDLGVYEEALVAPSIFFMLRGNVTPDTGDYPRPVIDPSVLPNPTRKTCLRMDSGSVVIEDMTFRNRFPMYPHTGDTIGGISHPNGHITLHRCVFDSTFHALWAYWADVTATECVFRNLSGMGIRSIRSVVATDCDFQSNMVLWAQLAGGSHSRVERCRFSGNYDGQMILICGDGYDIQVRDCIFGPGTASVGERFYFTGWNSVFENNVIQDWSVGQGIFLGHVNGPGPLYIRNNVLRNCWTPLQFPQRSLDGFDLQMQQNCDSCVIVFDSNTVENCTGHHGAPGMIAYGGYIEARFNRFTRISPAAVWSRDPLFVMRDNLIYENAVGLESDTNLITDARWNWWGDSTGPSCPQNPNGQGDPIEGDILFDPWYADTSFLPDASSDRSVALPSEYSLSVYPNPFNPSTSLRFGVEKAGRVTLEVFNVTGQRVQTLCDREYAAGYHAVKFDGQELPTGIYFAQIRAGEFVKTEKMVLLK
jgi:hypothetical protein